MKCFVLREKKPHRLRILYPEKLSFQSEGEIKTFSDKQKLREFVASKPVLQEMLKEVPQREGDDIGQKPGPT